MFRIKIAINGRYYVQKLLRYGWSRVSPFYNTRRQCRDFVAYERGCLRRGINRVVEYL